MDTLLKIKGLAKHYEGFDLQIDLEIPKGTIVGLIGSNGAGKTTTIKSVLDLVHPDAGSIKLFDTEIRRESADQVLGQLKNRIGFVFDSNSFPQEITINGVESIMRRAYSDWDAALFEFYREQFELPRDKKTSELSRGMGMKLSLACALSHKAELLLLDEATAGLDPLAREETLNILRRYMEDESRGILMSSHITSDLEKIADYIVCIDKGKVVFNLEKDAITDFAGIAQCRVSEFETLVQDGYFEPGEMRYAKHTYGVAVLIPDRYDFAREYPKVAIDRMTIDDYMNFMLKGDLR